MSERQPGEINTREGLVIGLRVILGVVALAALATGCQVFIFTGGQSRIWPVCAVLMVVAGWLAGRGLSLTRAREQEKKPESSEANL